MLAHWLTNKLTDWLTGMIRGGQRQDISSNTLRISAVAFLASPFVVALDDFFHAALGGTSGVPQLVGVTVRGEKREGKVGVRGDQG